MRFPIFFARYVVGFYVAMTLVLILVSLVDWGVARYVHLLYPERRAPDELKFYERVTTAVLWPVLLFSRKGRNMLRRSWRNIL